jgi:hypothetical protein
VYGRRQHVVSVFSWPTCGRDTGVTSASSHGYHTLRWREGGVEHSVVSDLGLAELARSRACSASRSGSGGPPGISRGRRGSRLVSASRSAAAYRRARVHAPPRNLPCTPDSAPARR